MKIASDKSDALALIKEIHKEIIQIQKDLSELEYLIYEKDERAQFRFIKREQDETIQGD